MKTSKLAFGFTFICLLMLGAGPMVFGGVQSALAEEGMAHPAGDLQNAPKAAPEMHDATQTMEKAASKTATKAAAETMKPAEKAMMKHKRMAHRAMRVEKVKILQGALNKAGYSLKEDGIMGKKTRMALKEYQKANNLKPTGHPDKVTRMKLGIM
jgi:hypothetical protein